MRQADGAMRDEDRSPVAALRFSCVPHRWYYAAPVESLRKPVEVTVGDRCYVAFAAAGRASVLDGRCPHFSAHLARETVEGGCLHCPMHGWRFRPDGTCDGIPSGDVPPPAARLTAYPTSVVGGHLFFHTDRNHAMPMPFFDDVRAEELVSAPPFSVDVEMPWWLVSANGFDGQHFLATHDRRLATAPTLLRRDDEFQACATFDVIGREWRERLTRWIAGPQVEMNVRSAGGSLVLVTSRSLRSVTYGLVSIHPRTATSAHVRTIVWQRSRSGALRAFDALDVQLRARFIRVFIQSDIAASHGVRYDRSRTVGADAMLTSYLEWLSRRDDSSRIASGRNLGSTVELP